MHRPPRVRWASFGAAIAALLAPIPAQASMFHGETLDKIADVMTWVVLIIAPVIAIAVFWMVHILPEKIAEKKGHPQAKAIQCLCLLSLVFGGLLWPLAWLWTYTKPTLHKLAYGTDKDDHHESPEAKRTRLLKELQEVERAMGRDA
jgi:CBS domain containing-hemolysin-like protein